MAQMKDPVRAAAPIDNISVGRPFPRESTLIYDGHVVRLYHPAFALYLMLRT
jgi:hypothetical protein